MIFTPEECEVLRCVPVTAVGDSWPRKPGWPLYYIAVSLHAAGYLTGSGNWANIDHANRGEYWYSYYPTQKGLEAAEALENCIL